jgi:hypothetical protein
MAAATILALMPEDVSRVLEATRDLADVYRVHKALRSGRRTGGQGYLEVVEVSLTGAQALWLENALEAFLQHTKNQPVEGRRFLIDFSSRRVLRVLRGAGLLVACLLYMQAARVI